MPKHQLDSVWSRIDKTLFFLAQEIASPRVYGQLQVHFAKHSSVKINKASFFQKSRAAHHLAKNPLPCHQAVCFGFFFDQYAVNTYFDVNLVCRFSADLIKCFNANDW